MFRLMCVAFGILHSISNFTLTSSCSFFCIFLQEQKVLNIFCFSQNSFFSVLHCEFMIHWAFAKYYLCLLWPPPCFRYKLRSVNVKNNLETYAVEL